MQCDVLQQSKRWKVLPTNQCVEINEDEYEYEEKTKEFSFQNCLETELNGEIIVLEKHIHIHTYIHTLLLYFFN